MAAQAFLDAMAEKGISTDKGTIGMQMNMENAALDFRMQGFRDYMAEKAPGLTLTDTEYNDNDSADAQADARTPSTLSALTSSASMPATTSPATASATLCVRPT